MEFNYNIAGVFLLAYFVMIIIRDAFNKLTWGRIRRIEDEKEALRIKNLMNDIDKYHIVLKIIKNLIFSIFIIQLYLFYKQEFNNNNFNIILSLLFTVIACLIIPKFLAQLLLVKFDILILKISSPIIKMLSFLLFPIILIEKLFRNKVYYLEQHDEQQDKPTAEDEIMSLIEHSDEEKINTSELEEDEKRMIRGIFDLDNTPVREIMTPRVDVDALDLQSSINDAIDLFIQTGRSRIPIYSKSVDDIKGVILAKDFLNYKKIENSTLTELAHKAIYIPETKLIDDLLEEIKGTGNHIAVVIDEYGGTAGIISLEDIIEEIVGEIKDEYDTEEDVDSEPIQASDGSFLVDARTIIGDLNDLLESKIPEKEDVDTVGGFICGELGRIPETGETFSFYNIEFSILKADSRKILTIKIKETK